MGMIILVVMSLAQILIVLPMGVLPFGAIELHKPFATIAIVIIKAGRSLSTKN